MKRLAVLLLLLASCAPIGKLSTPSGRPEVSVRGASIQQLKDLCTAAMMPDGYRVELNSGYTLIMTKREEATFFQKEGDIQEATFNFSQHEGSVTIYHTVGTTENPGTIGSRVVPKNSQKEFEAQQKRLEIIAAEANRLKQDGRSIAPSRKL